MRLGRICKILKEKGKEIFKGIFEVTSSRKSMVTQLPTRVLERGERWLMDHVSHEKFLDFFRQLIRKKTRSRSTKCSYEKVLAVFGGQSPMQLK